MAEDLYALTLDDVNTFKELVTEYRNRKTTRPVYESDVDDYAGTAPQTYIVRAPKGGIAGINQNTTGTGTPALWDDSISDAECQVYYKDSITGVLHPVEGKTLIVNNPSLNSIAEYSWVLVTRDAYNDWYAISVVGVSSSFPTSHIDITYVSDWSATGCTIYLQKTTATIGINSLGQLTLSTSSATTNPSFGPLPITGSLSFTVPIPSQSGSFSGTVGSCSYSGTLSTDATSELISITDFSGIHTC